MDHPSMGTESPAITLFTNFGGKIRSSFAGFQREV